MPEHAREKALVFTGPVLYYFINDHLGTPQMVVDETGKIAWQGDYLPFGEVQVVVDEVGNSIRFPGQYFDDETGLHYNWNRYYNPGTGRYISADPIGLDGGINLFAYVGGNPVNGLDPWGLLSFEDVKSFAEDGRVRALGSFGVGLLTQVAACNLDSGELKGILFGASSALSFHGAAEAIVVSGGTAVAATLDPDPGASRIALAATSIFFYYMADSGVENGFDYLEAALNEFRDSPSECIDPCKELEKMLDYLGLR